jgi:hypothetical protein
MLGGFLLFVVTGWLVWKWRENAAQEAQRNAQRAARAATLARSKATGEQPAAAPRKAQPRDFGRR